jgi:hypothetical protein
MVENQNSYQSDQNFVIDIEKIYNDFIREIDSIRSFVNITSGSNLQILNSIDSKTVTGITKKLKVEDTVQESRCHAFFRLIGFPVVSEDGIIYNPGLDNIHDINDLTLLENKIVVANKPISGFNDLSIARETYVSSLRNIFSFNTSIEASTVALSAGTNIRKFAVPLEKISTSESDFKNGKGVFSTNPKDQSYKVELNSMIGNQNVKLTEYKDVSGNKPSTDKLTGNRTHIIIPFVVDPRIDFSVSPSTNKIAVPFTFNKTNTKIDENSFAKRPLIEKIIRDRFTNSSNFDKIGTANQNLFNKIQSNQNYKDISIVQNITKDTYKLSEQLQFIQFFNIIKGMMSLLIKAQKIIEDAQKRYYYLPIPSTIGPEGGSTVQNVIATQNFVIDNTGTPLVTENDQEIINASVIATVNQISAQTANANGVSDLGGFAFDSFKTTFNTDSSESLGDINANNLKELTTKRNNYLKKANDALRVIEIITGEFSGLGLCDIVAIMGALYVMPKNNLTGFLDDRSYTRMMGILKLPDGNPAHTDISASMVSLTNNVKDFYNLMDKAYIDAKQNNGKAT